MAPFTHLLGAVPGRHQRPHLSTHRHIACSAQAARVEVLQASVCGGTLALAWRLGSRTLPIRKRSVQPPAN